MEENTRSWKITHSSWIIISFMPFFNGFSFLWIGTRADKKKWLYEGTLYELPLILMLILSQIDITIFTIIFMFWIITWFICIFRSFYVRNEYLTYLKTINSKNNHEDFRWEIIHSLWILLSLIPFLNGIGFVWIGFHAKKSKWLYEGLLYEAMFFVFIFLGAQPNLLVLSFSIYLITWFISILRSFYVRNDYLNILRTQPQDNNSNTTAKKLDLDINTYNEHTDNIKNNEYSITTKKLDLNTNTSNESTENSKEDNNEASNNNDLDENNKNIIEESNSRKLDF